MNIALGADHRGFGLKEKVKIFLRKLGHQVKDFGCFNKKPCDYPDFAFLVAEAVSRQRYDLGILICATGVGMSIAANKVPNIRAALVYNKEVASLASKHNKTNILCLGSETVSKNEAYKIIKAWLVTPFSKEKRYAYRIEKIASVERNYLGRKSNSFRD